MSEVRWCCRCQRVLTDPEESDPGGELACPHCGAPAGNLQTWRSVRERNPHWPLRPTVGKAYRVRKLENC